jgi:hypothetical protein
MNRGGNNTLAGGRRRRRTAHTGEKMTRRGRKTSHKRRKTARRGGSVLALQQPRAGYTFTGEGVAGTSDTVPSPAYTTYV